MTDNPGALPLPEADRLVREKIEHHREQMGHWRRVRAERLAAERAAGLSVAEIASAIGVHEQVVYQLLRADREAGAKVPGRPPAEDSATP